MACKPLVGSSISHPTPTFRRREIALIRRSGALQRLLLIPAFLAGVGDAGLARGGGDAVGGAAFAADGFDAGVALLDGDGLAL